MLCLQRLHLRQQPRQGGFCRSSLALGRLSPVVGSVQGCHRGRLHALQILGFASHVSALRHGCRSCSPGVRGALTQCVTLLPQPLQLRLVVHNVVQSSIALLLGLRRPCLRCLLRARCPCRLARGRRGSLLGPVRSSTCPRNLSPQRLCLLLQGLHLPLARRQLLPRPLAPTAPAGHLVQQTRPQDVLGSLHVAGAGRRCVVLRKAQVLRPQLQGSDQHAQLPALPLDLLLLQLRRAPQLRRRLFGS